MDTFSFAGIDVQTLGAVIIAGIILTAAARVLVAFSAVVRVAGFLVLGCIVVGGVAYAKELVTGDITADDLTQFRNSVTESWPTIQESVDQVLPNTGDVPMLTGQAWNAGAALFE